MAYETLDQIQVINNGEVDIVLLGNKIGYIPIFLPTDSTFGWEINWAYLNGVGPMESSIDNMMEFMGVKKISMKLNLSNNTFRANIKTDGINIGSYNFDEVLMYLFSEKLSINCKKELLTTEDYGSYKSNNKILKEAFRRRKSIQMPIPNELTKFTIESVSKNYSIYPSIDEATDIENDLEYIISTKSKDGLEIDLKCLAEDTPNTIIPLLKKEGILSNDDFYTPKNLGAYNSFKKILKKHNTSVEKIIFHDTPTVFNKKVILPANIHTVSLMLNKKGDTKGFVVPPYLYLPFTLENKEFYIPEVYNKKSKNNGIMYG